MTRLVTTIVLAAPLAGAAAPGTATADDRGGAASPTPPTAGPETRPAATAQETPPAPAAAPATIAILPLDAVLPSYNFATGPLASGDAARDGACGSTSRSGGDLARRCTSDLVEAMVATQRFRVLDRDAIDRVLQEHAFHRGQSVDPKELARLGRLLGADRLVIGSLDLAGTECRRVEVRASGYVGFEFRGGIETAYRVVNVATGEIETMGRVTRTFDSRRHPELREVLAAPDGAAAFFSRQAAAAMTHAVLDAVDPVKVAALRDGAVILNQGRGRPIVPGMTLRVLTKGEPIRDPDTGAVLGEDGGEAAIVRVVDVDERVSRARVMAGDASKIAVGARCVTIDVPPPPG